MQSTALLTTAAGTGDIAPLATIDGATYYELAVIVRRTQPSGPSEIVGLARDWPVIQRDARIAELEALLTASQRHAEEAERHLAELLARSEPAALAPIADVTPPVETTAEQHTCVCGKSFKKSHGLNVHRAMCAVAKGEKQARLAEHPRPQPPSRPVIITARSTPEVPELRTPPWHCAQCGRDTFARSVADPARCISCVAHEQPTNGHALAAA